MRTVEDTHLALLIRRHIVHHLDGKPCLFKGKLIPDRLGSFDDPRGKNLSGVDELILITQLLPETGRIGLRRTGDDPVHQRGAEDVLFLQPGGEFVLQCPKLYVFVDATPEFLPVVVNELTGEDDDSGKPQLPALPQKDRELCGEGGRRRIVRFAGRIESDPRFRRIGDHETEYRVACAVQEFFPVALGIQAPGRGGDYSLPFHGLSVFASAQNQGIEAVLLGKAVRRFRVTAAGLNQNHLAVETGLLVHQVNEMVGECPQKVPFSKLYHTLGRIFQQITGIAQFFKRCKR